MQQKVTREGLAAAIRAEVANYAAQGIHLFEINNGYCFDLAHDICMAFGNSPDGLEDMVVEDLLLGHSFDRHLMAKHWAASVPPPGLSWRDLEHLGITQCSHSWLVLEGRHHDADVPDGADNLFDLPIFRRNLVEASLRLRPKQLAALESRHAWWRESRGMFEEYKAWVDAGRPGPAAVAVPPAGVPRP